MNREELEKILPQRPPMLLVDSSEKTGENTATGRYKVKGDEFFLQGHFPNNPIVPGVILCEMASQSASVILADKVAGKLTLFAGMNNVKFKTPVRPDDEVVFESELVRSFSQFYFIKVVGKVGENTVFSGEFSFCLADKQ